MTQKEDILAHLKKGHSITPLEALSQFGCFRLASVVCKLKNEGYNIKSNIQEIYTEEGVKKFARYWIPKEEKKPCPENSLLLSLM